MPLEGVIEILTPRRHPGHNAVFSINFIYQRSFIENVDYGSFKLVDLPSLSAGALHDLNFFMVERPEGWRLSCEYNAGLYLQASIERLLRHFVNILSAISADPEAPLSRQSRFSMLTSVAIWWSTATTRRLRIPARSRSRIYSRVRRPQHPVRSQLLPARSYSRTAS